MVRRCLSEAESEGKWMMTRAPAQNGPARNQRGERRLQAADSLRVTHPAESEANRGRNRW